MKPRVNAKLQFNLFKMDDKRRLEGIKNVLLEMKEYANDGAVVVVEGEKDRRSLSSLGIRNCIKFPIKESLLNFSESLAREDRGIILLTDWDSKGEELSKIIEANLRNMGLSPDIRIRNRLKSLVFRDIKDVESLSRYLDRMIYDAFEIPTEQFLSKT
ncbi:MAG: hypothetical protein EF807_05030 [Candidatus Methanolliviera hydrocarbonicum]|jgi:Small primase-like proteins (Toprim domain)|uniref:Toprim domain-containing protein n=1 Tax=Candidatus Methanolliviera hydrocarbonicum TaxID=2491085 RepID=A0A520KWG4_9EURY|nr:MAG: hypothetical protein EF807_05030 [Candidatus Methanolliviera hydrocarbonicum]